MCGRYATTRTATDLSALFEALDTTSVLASDDGSPAGDVAAVGSDRVVIDYNVAPTDPVPIVRMSATAGGRVLSVARWGLVPPWAADRRVGARMINSRAETVATTKAFARPFATRRCLVPATGWYEFAATAGSTRKQPYFMTPRNGEPVVFGGLWSVWGPSGDRLLTCSIVTTAAIGDLTSVHNRMPLMLSRDRWSAWLTATADLDGLLEPPTDADVEALEIRPVGVAVGDVRNDGPQLIERLPEPADAAVDLTLF
jgi:putative SOS response-associated peptidase YedK